MEFKDKIMLPCFREVKCLKCQQGYTAVIYYVYTILGYQIITCLSGLVVGSLQYYFGSPGSFPEGVYRSLFFNSDIKNFLLKINGGETESLILFF